MNDLYQTYENNLDSVGKITQRGQRSFTLLPISHAYANAQIEVLVTPAGDIFDCKVVPKDDAPTMVPVTEKSANRANAPAPHAVHDYLKYVAGDYQQYAQPYKKENMYEMYIDGLKAWCESDEANERVAAILAYLEKGSLIKDLIDAEILPLENGKLVSKWSEIKENSEKYPEKPEIFSVVTGEPINAFVRFTTHDPQKFEAETPVWLDMTVAQDFIRYTQNHQTAKKIDYVTGEFGAAASFHPSGIRYGGDMAKLISANDKTNFTFRGRFTDKDEAVIVGAKASQEAHNALKWLIAKQGYSIGGRVYLAWGQVSTDTISPVQNTRDQLFAADEEAESVADADTTQAQFAERFNQAIRGYQAKIKTREPIQIMILDNATPGRMGVLYYQSMDKELYLKRIETWRMKSEWQHRYQTKEKKWAVYWGAPSLKEIAEAAYGSRASEKLIKNAVEILFSCVVDGRSVPQNIYLSLLQRASNPLAMENWEWEKTLSTACSITHNYFYQEGLQVSLDKEYKDRSYLFGRLLAVAHLLESSALRDSSSGMRTTNAQRYMNVFSMHPLRTWKIIYENLSPYIARLGSRSIGFEKVIDEIMNQFSTESFNDSALDGKYLLGFHSQRHDYFNRNKEEEEK